MFTVNLSEDIRCLEYFFLNDRFRWFCRSEVIERSSSSHRRDPGCEAGGVLDFVQPLVQFQKHLLQDVGSDFGIAADLYGDRENQPLVLSDQLFPGVLIAGDTQTDKS